MLIVCTNCGWNREVEKKRTRGSKMYCPGCGSIIPIYERHAKETNWALWLCAGTAAVILVLGMLACIGVMLLRVVLDTV